MGKTIDSFQIDNALSICKRYTFEASHVLPDYVGACGRLHGHSYKVEVCLAGEVNERGMVMDFHELDTIMKPIIETLDHSHLNDIRVNPTAEDIATYINKRLYDGLKARNLVVRIESITLWETEKAFVILRPSYVNLLECKGDLKWGAKPSKYVGIHAKGKK